MSLLQASALRAAKFDPAQIRKIVEDGKKAGLLRAANETVPIAKDGKPVASEGALRSQWIDVTPEIASTWLHNNFRNRPLKEDVVDAYARDMQRGVWVPTHQGVAFNDRDELIDGQHRLHAIVKCGLTVRMMVTFGLPARIDGREMTTMDAVDRGRTRSVADQLTIQHGFKNASVTASICASIGSLCFGERTRRLSVGQTLEIFRAYESSITFVILHRPKEHGLRMAGVLAAFAFAGATEEGFFGGATPIAEMFLALVTGEKVMHSGGMYHLRKFLLSDEAKLLSRATDRGVAELALQAIWLERTVGGIEVLRMGTEGAKYYRAAQPERVAKIAEIFRLPATQKGKGGQP